MQINLTTLLLFLAAGFSAVEANKCLYTEPRKCSQGCPNGGCTGKDNNPDDVYESPFVALR
ncbi:uncharacterized protein FMAN_05330 [Fusarium mangiferae]|uniref:Uncharacterized protein n=1 Tax=Fusarium mangiferae TaxID=192010 RepID=A0A1L7STN2_FUSMA|nr:uncharacterized protein FMAN_05330 [Fusarium mangiferae]CVK87832.1 uncharacterized protein FMAN_05330 [Fusarium mangiferae]